MTGSPATTPPTALPGLNLVDRVRAAIAACAEGARPTTIEFALDLASGELRGCTEPLEDGGEIRFEQGRLHVVEGTGGTTVRSLIAGLKTAQRVTLHARLADAIGHTSYEPGTATLEQASHELLAGDQTAARTRLERGAHDAARAGDHLLVIHMLDLRMTTDALPDPTLLELHARAAVEQGDDRASVFWERTRDAWIEAGDDALAARSTVAWFWSSPESLDARSALDVLAATDSASDPAVSGWCAYARAVGMIIDASWSASIPPLEQALAAARNASDRSLEAAVLGSLATAHSYLGHMNVAIDLLRRSAPLAIAHSDVVAVRRIRHNLVETLVETLRTGEAVEEAARFSTDLERFGARHYLPGALALEARVRAIAGDITTARALVERAMRADRNLPEIQRDVYVHMVAAELLALGGDTTRFRGFVQDVAERCSEFGFDSYGEALDEVRSRAQLVSDEPDALVQLLRIQRDREPSGLAALALHAGRLRLEHHDHLKLAAAHDAVIEQLHALQPTAQRIPVVELAIRESNAVAARDVEALESIAIAWDVAGRPADATLVRRAALSVHPDRADDIDTERLAARLDSLGWGVLAKRQIGEEPDPDDVLLTLVQLPLIARLPVEERATVLDSIERYDLEPTAAGESTPSPPRGVCIVMRGEVRLLRAEPGTTERRLVVAALGPGDVFGHETLVDASEDALVEAAAPSSLRVVPAARLAQLMFDAPRFTAALLADASERLTEARLLAGESALLPVETRLARTLVRLAERFGRPSLRGDLLLDTSLTHADIASMIGSQRARVSSLLAALHKAGITDTWKRRIVVLNLSELRIRAGVPSATEADTSDIS